MKKKKVLHENNLRKKEKKQRNEEEKLKLKEGGDITTTTDKSKSIDQIEDTSILAQMYVKNNSRGKRQRIRNRLEALLKDKLQVSSIIKQAQKEIKTIEVISAHKNEYRTEVIEAKNTGLNVKAKQYRKNEKSNQANKDNKQFLNKKRTNNSNNK